MADGIFYRDTRTPFTIADFTGVTVVTTATTLWPVGASSPTILPANYWTVGKTVKLTAFVKWSSGTAGNYTFGMSYGAASNPACIVNSVARAYVASVGPFGVFIEGYATCRSIGTAGTLSMWGQVQPDLGIVLSTAGPSVFPSNGTTVVSTVDTTVGTNALMFHAIASAGTHTMTTVGLVMEALN
jgi:hypothetical protein